MEINDDAKEIVREICAAINSAVEGSTEVAEGIARLRDAGYEMELTLRLDIGLREVINATDDESYSSGSLELTEDDLRTLQRMKIRVDDEP